MPDPNGSKINRLRSHDLYDDLVGVRLHLGGGKLYLPWTETANPVALALS